MSSPSDGFGRVGPSLLLAGLWGASFFFFKVLVAAWPPMTVVMGRLILASLALEPDRPQPQGLEPPPREVWPGPARAGRPDRRHPFSLIAHGETKITSGLALRRSG